MPSKNSPPKPETTRAILPSAAFVRPGATVHFYRETRLTTIKGTGGRPDSQAWEHIFECAKTGARRRWGLEPVHGATDDIYEDVN